MKTIVKSSIFASIVILTIASICFIAFNMPQFINTNFIYPSIEKNIYIVKTEYLQGTAFGVDFGEGYLVTAFTICESSQYAAVEIIKDGIISYAKIVNFNRKDDICLLERVEGMSGMKIKSSTGVYTDIFSIAYQLDKTIRLFKGQRMSQGVIHVPKSVVGNEIDHIVCLQQGNKEVINPRTGELICMKKYNIISTNMQTVIGFGGGPVLDLHGNVIGMLVGADNNGNAVFTSAQTIKNLILVHETQSKLKAGN